jgi:hypothetical protein
MVTKAMQCCDDIELSPWRYMQKHVSSLFIPSEFDERRFTGGDGHVFDWPYLTHARPFNRAE